MVTLVSIGDLGVPWRPAAAFLRAGAGMGYEVVGIDERGLWAEVVLGRVKDVLGRSGGGTVVVVYVPRIEIAGDWRGLWAKLRELGVRTATFEYDLYRGLEREQWVGRTSRWGSEVVFTADGGSLTWMRERGVNAVFLPAGIAEEYCYLAEERPGTSADVAFIGTVYSYFSEWPYRRQLVDRLRQRYGKRFVVVGDGDFIRGHDLNRFVAGCRVIVGDSLCSGFSHSWYWSDRLYEVLGRGGVMVFPWVAGITTQYTDGEHVVYYRFGDWEGLFAAVDRLLEATDTATMRRAAVAHTKARHTYGVRLREIVAVLTATEGQVRPR